MADIKWSSFTNGGAMVSGDQLVGLRAGNNVRLTTNPIILWTSISGTTQSAAINSAYVVSNAAQTTITLPVTAPLGSVVAIAGNGAGGWILVPGAGQTIKVLTASASVSVTSAEQYDCIEVVCVVANTTWVARNMVTTGFTIS